MAEVSTGNVAITATVAATAAITGLQDVNLESDPAVQRICIEGNSFNGRFDLAASGDTDATGFVVRAADGTSAPLTLSWTDGAGLTSEIRNGGSVRALNASQPCSGAGASTLTMATPSTQAARWES